MRRDTREILVAWIIGTLAIAALCAALVGCAASPASADVFDALAISGAAADVVTTEVGLRRGFVEQNIQNRGFRIGANVALTSGCLLGARELEREGHRGWAKVLKAVPFVVFGGAAVKNIHTMRGR